MSQSPCRLAGRRGGRERRGPQTCPNHLAAWQDGAAVESGAVRTQRAFFEACSGASWVGEASFVWRDTTLELGWSAGLPC